MDGYCVRTSVKLGLTKEERVRIGRPSSARWKLDIVGYSGRDNVLCVVECEGYLDSRGVVLRAFDGPDAKSAEHCKLTTSAGRELNLSLARKSARTRRNRRPLGVALR